MGMNNYKPNDGSRNEMRELALVSVLLTLLALTLI
jgi:hypothetical protein